MQPKIQLFLQAKIDVKKELNFREVAIGQRIITLCTIDFDIA